MAIKVIKKEKENSQNLVHRFTKIVRQSGLLLDVRQKQFHKRSKSKLAKKLSALRRVQLQNEKMMAEKMGKPLIKR